MAIDSLGEGVDRIENIRHFGRDLIVQMHAVLIYLMLLSLVKEGVTIPYYGGLEEPGSEGRWL